MRTQKLIIDIKNMFEHANTTLCTTTHELERALRKGEHALFRPELNDWDAVNDAFDLAYHRGNITVYNDERGGWPRKLMLDMLPAESYAVLRGRQSNVSVWTGAQRPSRIPVHLMSEADHFFVFRLQHGLDRKKVAAFAGDSIEKPIIDRRWFWYSGPDSSEVLYPPVRT